MGTHARNVVKVGPISEKNKNLLGINKFANLKKLVIFFNLNNATYKLLDRPRERHHQKRMH